MSHVAAECRKRARAEARVEWLRSARSPQHSRQIEHFRCACCASSWRKRLSFQRQNGASKISREASELFARCGVRTRMIVATPSRSARRLIKYQVLGSASALLLALACGYSEPKPRHDEPEARPMPSASGTAAAHESAASTPVKEDRPRPVLQAPAAPKTPAATAARPRADAPPAPAPQPASRA